MINWISPVVHAAFADWTLKWINTERRNWSACEVKSYFSRKSNDPLFYQWWVLRELIELGAHFFIFFPEYDDNSVISNFLCRSIFTTLFDLWCNWLQRVDPSWCFRFPVMLDKFLALDKPEQKMGERNFLISIVVFNVHCG